jgi:uncharacterized membrane protein YvlD (DUF360 family)
VLSASILLIVSVLMLWITIALIPGIAVNAAGDVVVATLLLVAASAFLRPVLGRLASWLGWLGIALIGLVAQGVIFFIALSLTPGISVSGFWPAFGASWLYAGFVSLTGWVLDAGDDEMFFHDVVRGGRRTETTPTDAPGVVIVQIDGLPAPLLQWALQAGDLPTLSRWVRGGSHAVVEWRAQLPATTPASQAGILHGRSDAVPAFRWYEKESARLTVTNRPKDAAYVERGMTDGRGLLADGGVSIGNIFSGDAPVRLLTISSGARHGPSRQFAAAYLRPYGFARSLVLTLAEMVKELRQGRQQRARGVQPRIDRRGSYVVLRGVTNVLLRDLNVRLLAEQMMAGAPVMYCDFTDYDEVAHHAGPTRPESLASLFGVDRAIGVLERVAARAPRPYTFVVLSDHGQSQGSTFRQRYGESLEQVVRRLVTQTSSDAELSPAASIDATGRDEEWGPSSALLREVGQGRGGIARLSRQLLHRHERDHPTAPASGEVDLVVTGSGNLGLVYFPQHSGRMSYEALERRFPGLLTKLAAHDGIGFLVVDSDRHGTVVVGSSGTNFIDAGRVSGVDPLLPFGPEAVNEIKRHSGLRHVGDIVVNSRVDESTGEVAAFEELVGCHGGLGGWQSAAVLVHPLDWSPPGQLVGADAVHAQLVRWLEELGLRASFPSPSPPSVSQPVRVR